MYFDRRGYFGHGVVKHMNQLQLKMNECSDLYFLGQLLYNSCGTGYIVQRNIWQVRL